MYSLYGIHGNMKAAPVFQRKKAPSTKPDFKPF